MSEIWMTGFSLMKLTEQVVWDLQLWNTFNCPVYQWTWWILWAEYYIKYMQQGGAQHKNIKIYWITTILPSIFLREIICRSYHTITIGSRSSNTYHSFHLEIWVTLHKVRWLSNQNWRTVSPRAGRGLSSHWLIPETEKNLYMSWICPTN